LLDEAVRRYECMWLPLLRKYIKANGNGDDPVCKVICVPPLDVAYIWHVHRLDPKYPSYCKQALGRVAVPQRPFAFATTPNTPLWNPEERFHPWNLTEPFYPPKLDPKNTPIWHAARRPTVDGSLEPHLQEAVKRQASFGHMFLRLCYQDRTYLEQVRPAHRCLRSAAEYVAMPPSRGQLLCH
jgi:hypothetical protein